MEYVILFATAIIIAVLAVSSSRRAKAEGKRPTGSLTGGFGVLDEVFHPTAYQAHTIQEVEQRMPAPAPLAGDLGPDGDGD